MSTDATWRTPLTSLLWLLVFVCAEPSTAPRDRSRLTALSFSQDPASRATTDHMQEFSWWSGLTDIDMGSISGRVCFLSVVTGEFRTDSYVRIHNFNGSWHLGGSFKKDGADEGLTARARCNNAYSYTGEYSWSQGQDAKSMGSPTGRSCFLTGVGGGFAGSGERAEVYSGNTASWWLGGSSKHFGVHARARCLIYPPAGAQQPYTYTGWITSSSEVRVLQPTSWKCYLAGMRGAFEGSGARVAVFADGGFWRLGVRAQDIPANEAKVGCTR